MNRIDRLSAILIQLQSKPVIKAQEIATRFGISLRTVYRDVRALEEAGIPIGSEAGIGYFLAEGFHLPPVMFTKKEAGSLLLAEKLVEKMTDRSVDQYFKSAMYKIKSILDNSDKNYLENLEMYIDIAQATPSTSDDFPNNFITDIQDAIAHRKIIIIEYLSFSKNEVTKREIEPVGICYYGSSWHLIGFCRLRNDYRDFRIDRIKSLSDSGNYFTTQKKKSLQEYFDLLSSEASLEKVIVRFSKSMAKYIEKQKYYFGFVDETEKNDSVEMIFLITPLEYIGKWLLTYGKDVEIVFPDTLKRMMKKFVVELQEHYSVD